MSNQGHPTDEQVLALYRNMQVIRHTEEELARCHQRGLIHVGVSHLRRAGSDCRRGHHDTRDGGVGESITEFTILLSFIPQQSSGFLCPVSRCQGRSEFDIAAVGWSG